MVKHNQTIRWQKPTNCLSVFDHFLGLALKGLKTVKLRGIIFQTNILHKPPRKLWLSDIFRGYWKRTLAWDALKIKNWTYFCLTHKNFCFYISKKYQFHQQSKKYIQFFNKTATELLKFVVSTCRTFSCHSTLKLLRQDLKIVPSPISHALLFKDSHYCGRKIFCMTNVMTSKHFCTQPFTQ